jgi:hypothetical protein
MTEKEVEDILANEALINAVIAMRKPPEEAEKSKSWKELIFETGGGVALVTVLLGGLLGSGATTLFQWMQKKNETAHAEQQAYLERQRAANERLEKLQLDSAKTLFDLTYKGISASDDLLQLSTPAFADPRLANQRTDIRTRYNEAEESWRSNHASQGLMFIYYHRSMTEIPSTWKETEQAVSKYIECASTWLLAHPFYQPGLGPGCSEERKSVDREFASLEQALVIGGNAH